MAGSRSIGIRAAATLAAAVAVVVILAGVTPGASKPLTRKKALGLFYTRAETDARFLDQAEADSKFVDPSEAEGIAATTYTVVRTENTVGANGQSGVSAPCPDGQVATGGGLGSTTGMSLQDAIMQSGPVDDQLSFALMEDGEVPTGWFGRYVNNTGTPENVYVYVICAAG